MEHGGDDPNRNSWDRDDMIKQQIIAALSHPEADEGLYFRNLYLLHEVDDRPPVIGEQSLILEALSELVAEGRVVMKDSGDEAIFLLQEQ